MSAQVDYIIVGQGLAGSALAMECIKRGKRIHVFDEPDRNRSSVISAGICNPITGRVMSKTYLAEKLFPFLQDWFAEAQRVLDDQFFVPLAVYRPFLSEAEQYQWLEKSVTPEMRLFVKEVRAQPYQPENLHNPYGGLEIQQSGVLDVARWAARVRKFLIGLGVYEEAFLDERELETAEEVTYKNVRASKVIFCNGLAARHSRFFGWLPLRPLKGETLTIRMAFPREKIISRGVYLVPSRIAGVFTAGSTYQHEPFAESTTGEAKAHIEERLRALVRVPFEVIHQDWGIRPTVSDRRPLLGSHPHVPNVIIFNGLGTKGVSLTPYFASALMDWLDKGSALPEEVNISRFKSLYSDRWGLGL